MADSDVHEAIQLDADIDALVSPNVSQLWRAMHGYTAEATGAVAAHRAMSGGGSGPSTATATVTANQGNGYSVSHVFDLGSAGPHPVEITLTGLTLTGDGETFGNDSGMIYVGPTSADPVQPGPHTDVDVSADGVVYGKAFEIAVGPQTAADGVSPTLEIQSTGVPAGAVCTSARYLKVPIAIVENSTGAIYAGANHPSAQVRIDIRYL